MRTMTTVTDWFPVTLGATPVPRLLDYPRGTHRIKGLARTMLLSLNTPAARELNLNARYAVSTFQDLGLPNRPCSPNNMCEVIFERGGNFCNPLLAPELWFMPDGPIGRCLMLPIALAGQEPSSFAVSRQEGKRVLAGINDALDFDPEQPVIYQI